MSPKRIFLSLLIIMISINSIISQKKITSKKRELVPNPFLNATTKDSKKLKLHSKILQTVYSDIHFLLLMFLFCEVSHVHISPDQLPSFKY